MVICRWLFSTMFGSSRVISSWLFSTLFGFSRVTCSWLSNIVFDSSRLLQLTIPYIVWIQQGDLKLTGAVDFEFGLYQHDQSECFVWNLRGSVINSIPTLIPSNVKKRNCTLTLFQVIAASMVSIVFCRNVTNLESQTNSLFWMKFLQKKVYFHSHWCLIAGLFGVRLFIEWGVPDVLRTHSGC